MVRAYFSGLFDCSLCADARATVVLTKVVYIGIGAIASVIVPTMFEKL